MQLCGFCSWRLARNARVNACVYNKSLSQALQISPVVLQVSHPLNCFAGIFSVFSAYYFTIFHPTCCSVNQSLPHKSHLLSTECSCGQIVVYTIRLNVPLHMYIENEVTGMLYVALKVLLVLCGIWSLDFFRAVIPPFCVSSNIKTVHALALEYLVAFYPTYVCINLHDSNFRPIVQLWKPFHKHFIHFRRKWDSKASIINAFTTFLLLSFSKILFISFTLGYTIQIRYRPRSAGAEKKDVLYYDPTVEVDARSISYL